MELLQCPRCFANLNISVDGNFLVCKKEISHRFPILNGIPSFVKKEDVSSEDAKWIFEYDEMAERYDEAIKRYDEWLGVNLEEEFRGMIRCLPIKSSNLILDVSTGTGSVIFRIKECFPDLNLEFVGTDLSMGMLRVAQRKFAKANLQIPLFHSHVNNIPFKDESFDVVIHVGGINTFKNIPSALKEWVRVLKPEGFLLIADEGLSPTARKTRRGVKIVESNRLFGLKPPLAHLPPQLKKVQLWWIARDTFYVIMAQKLSSEELESLNTEPNMPKAS
jgi:ubiquinone/menaquinone biosynthesis C-methylase UbiE